MRISNATSRVHLSRTRRLMTRPPGLSSALAPLPGGVTDGPVCPLCWPLSFVGTSRVGVCGSSSVKRRLLFLSVAPSGNWSVLDFFFFFLCVSFACVSIKKENLNMQMSGTLWTRNGGWRRQMKTTCATFIFHDTKWCFSLLKGRLRY